MRKPKKRLEFSKILVLLVTAMTVVVTVFSMWFAAKTLDPTVLLYLIPAIFTEFAAVTGFYYNKAKAENTKGGIVYDCAAREQQNYEEDDSE